MRDFVAIVVVLLLVLFALSMATSLQWYRRSHARIRRAVVARGQSIVAEIPAPDGLLFFTEDTDAFHWSDRVIPKNQIRAARVLISGAPISVQVSTRFAERPGSTGSSKQDTAAMDSIERDRWDVAIDLQDETVLVECGAIRDRVSQELARQVFDVVRRDIETRDVEHASKPDGAAP